MQRLSPLDVTFLHVEDDVSHMNLGLVGVFEGPPPAQAELLEGLMPRFDRARRYRQRVRRVPLEAGRPVWHDDPHFAPGYHVRRTALPSPGGDAELQALVGRVMSQQLDRARPLWELWVIEGLSGGRWALIAKFHHAMVDGISGSSLIGALLDTEREGEPLAPQPWTPAPEPGAASMVASALADRAARTTGELRAAAWALARPRRLGGEALASMRGLASFGGIVRPAASSPLNGPLGPHREWAWARASLVDVREIRAAFEDRPSINDVVLAAITGGLRTLLASEGESEPAGAVRSLVPVSVRARSDSGVPDNRVSAMVAELPVQVDGPLERLHAVTAEMRRLKASHETDAGQAITSGGQLAPELALALGGWIATRLPQRSVNTVTTNVPGPQHPLFLCGRRMLEAFPYVPLAGHVRLGTAIYSYDGAIAFGVTGDVDAPLRALDLCRSIEAEMSELRAAVASRTGARGRRAAGANAPASAGRRPKAR